jgi:hypothetical protein
MWPLSSLIHFRLLSIFSLFLKLLLSLRLLGLSIMFKPPIVLFLFSPVFVVAAASPAPTPTPVALDNHNCELSCTPLLDGISLPLQLVCHHEERYVASFSPTLI